jgi:hypothetical protein
VSRTTANYLLWDGPLFDGIIKIVTLTVAKEILTCQNQSLSAFIHHATLFGHWKCSWRPQVLNGYISVNWNCCAGDEVTAGQTDGDWMNIAQYCPLTAQYCARRTTDCSTLRSNVNWLLNIAQCRPLTVQYCAVVSTDCSTVRSTVHWLLMIA